MNPLQYIFQKIMNGNHFYGLNSWMDGHTDICTDRGDTISPLSNLKWQLHNNNLWYHFYTRDISVSL